MRRSEGRGRIEETDVVPWELLGVTTYRGVVIGWDEDRDERIYKLIDAIKTDFPTEPAFVSEHEAEVVIVWHGPPPAQFAQGETLWIDDDAWSIRSSATSK